MIRFLSFSLLFLFLCSCGTLQNLENFQEVPVEDTLIGHNVYFLETNKDHLYKAQISIYGKDLSGVLAFKKTNDTLWRAALISEFGSTLLDISFNKTYSNLNYGIHKLDKKYIVNTLLEDFRLLVLPERNVVKTYENSEMTLLKTQGINGFVYYYLNKKNQCLQKMIKTKSRKKKISVYFSNFKGKKPSSIKIIHHNLRLDIILNTISQPHAD